MPRKMKLEGKNLLILKEIANGNIYPSKIAKALNIAPPYITQHIKTLKKNGYVVTQKKGILTEIGFTQLGLETVKVLQINPVGILKPIHFRMHDIALNLKLKDEVKPSDKQTLIASSRLVPMKNHVDLVLQAEGYKARLYPNSLTIYLPDITLPLTADLELATSTLMDKLEEIVPKLEAKLGIKVIRLDKDTLKASLVNMHIALVNHQFAETINEKGEKLYVYDDNNILRVIVDYSHNKHEYEGVAPSYVIEDVTKLAKLTKGVIQGRFDYEKEQQLALQDRANIHLLIEGYKHEQLFAKSHNDLVKEVKELIKELREERKQRRL